MGRIFVLLAIVASFAAASLHGQTQVQTGPYPFGPSVSYGFDTINPANLNVHFEIPIISKPGRGGTSFTYNLAYDSSIWSIVTVSGQNYWTPTPTWGWSTITQAEVGYVTYSEGIVGGCAISGDGEVAYTGDHDYAYHDQHGIVHPIAGVIAPTNPCGEPVTSFTSSTTDGSGYTVAVTFQSASATVYDRAGAVYIVPVGATPSMAPGSGTYTDTNGNTIAANSNGTFTDTLGKTVLTVSGSAPNPVTYTYTDSNGSPQTVTMNYQSYNVQTNFGVSGDGEYSASGVSLVTSIDLPDGSAYHFTYEPTPGNSSAITGRIASVTLRTGGTISYVYTGGSNGIEPDGSASGLNRTTSDGTTSFTRSVASATQTSTTKVDAMGNATAYSFVGDNIGHWYESSNAVYQGAAGGTPLSNETVCYVSGTCSATSVSLPITVRDVTTYRNGQQVSTDDQQYNSVGLLTNDQLNSNTTAYQYTDVNNAYRLSQVSLNNNAAQTSYGYDSHGNMTSMSRYLNTSGGNLTTTMTYDGVGNVLTMVDPNGNTTQYTYDSSDSYPTEITLPPANGVAHVTSYAYDLNTGLVTSTTDMNHQTTSYSYDEMKRLTGTTYPDGGRKQVSYTPTSTTQQVLQSGSTWLTSTTDYDGYGRLIHQSHADGSTTDTSYDADGRVGCTSNPHGPSGSSTDGDTCYSYDAANRVTTITNPDGSRKTASYSGLTATTTDEVGHQRSATLDSFGRVATLAEPGPSGSLTWNTVYSYNPLNEVTQVQQQGGSSNSALWRTRTFAYDSLGRMTQQTSPEAGTTSFRYDGDGNLIGKTDARGISISYAYDALNRLISKSSSDGSLSNSYDYDGASVGVGGAFTSMNPIGRLVEEANNVNASSQFSYDAMGRIVYQANCIPSNCTQTGNAVYAAYDLAGEMTSLTYPDGRVVTQSFSQGHLTNVSYNSWNGQAVNYNYLASASYAPSGLLQSMAYGNGTTGTYSWNNRWQPTETAVQMTATGINQTVYDTHYCYGPADSRGCGANGADNGNILSALSLLGSAYSQGFGYDNLNRLTSFNNGADTMAQTFSYDAWGNLTQSGTQSFQAAYTGNNQIVLSGFGYDAAGHLTQANFGSPLSFAYNADGLLTTVNNGADTYTYDALGQRVRKDTPAGWTEYVRFGGKVLAEKNSDGSWSDYIYANGQRIARADSYDERIHIEGTSTVAGSYAAWYLPFATYVIKSGDKISWRQYQAGAVGGIGISFTDGTTTNWTAKDTNGQVINDDSTQNAWDYRTVDLTPYAGKTTLQLWIAAGAGTPVGSWNGYFSDLAIYSSDGSVIPIYARQPSVGLTYWTGGGETNTQAFVERSNQAGDSEFPQGTTTYYQNDQIGSARMQTAGGGWPVSQDVYYPYGVEPTPPADANHYKFASLERDAETGLDHAWFRQYASQMGRWLSPDPYNGSYDLMNPQSFNRYAYVGNNPLTHVDPTGLYLIWVDVWGGGCDLTCSIGIWGFGGGEGGYAPSGGVGGGSGGGTGSPGKGPTGPGTFLEPPRFNAPQAPPTKAPNNGPTVLNDPCQYQGQALPPSAYAAQGQAANGSLINFVLDVSMGLPRGNFLDPQPLASGTVYQRQGYGNYTFGVYTQAAGLTLSQALSGANAYAAYSLLTNWAQYSGDQMDANYQFLPAASVTNITNGYNAQATGTTCQN
jgi:RHS repeat-associated protein